MRGTALGIAAAIFCVVAVGVVIAGFWNDLGASEITPAGWLAMIFGVLLTLGLGIGLMALMFFSSRRGYDDGAGDRDRKYR